MREHLCLLEDLPETPIHFLNAVTFLPIQKMKGIYKKSINQHFKFHFTNLDCFFIGSLA